MTDIFKYTVFDKLSWKDIAIPTSGFNGFTTLAVAIALIGFFVTTILRVANMFVQMLLAPLYVPYVLMGDQQKWIEWFLSVISVGFTYVIQYSVFYAGFMITYYSTTDLTNKLIGIGLLFATFGVPKAMAKFGWSSGSANAFRSAGQTAATLLMRMPLK